jgi:hypothetical protein
MNKNRTVVVIVAALVFVGGFFAVNSGMAQAVQVPQQINLWLVAVTFAAVAAGLDWLFIFTSLDFRGLAAELAGTLSAFVVLEFQNIINLIPATFDPYVSFVFTVLVVLLGGAGVLRVIALFRGSKALLA